METATQLSAQNDQQITQTLSTAVMVGIAVIIAGVVIAKAIGAFKKHSTKKDSRRFYAIVSSMWDLAKKLANPVKGDNDATRTARASIKRFQTQNKKLRGFDDPRMFDMANHLYKLLNEYQQASNDENARNRLSAQVEGLKSTGLW